MEPEKRKIYMGLSAAVRHRILKSRPDLAFIAIFTIAACLRLGSLDRTQFLLDSAGIYAIAQDALAQHAIPATGIVASIQSFCQPASVYLYLPFVLLRDPVYGAYGTALANLLAVSLTYLWARRYLGYVPAIVSTLLFAVAAWPVEYSRFIWQQNLLPPFVVWFMLVLAAALAGRRAGWLAWALPLWGILVQLHPTTLGFGALILLVCFLAPQSVRLKDAIIGAACLFVLFIPTIMWEVESSFYDVRAYLAYVHRAPTTDLSAIHQFLIVSGLPSWTPWQGTPLFMGLVALSRVVVALALLYLLVRLIHPALQVLRNRVERQASTPVYSLLGDAIRWLRAPEQARWRIDMLLLAWPGLIVFSQLRHYSPLYPHYMNGTFPAQFLVTGVLIADALHVFRRWRLSSHQPMNLIPAASFTCVSLLVAILTVAQIAATPLLYAQVDQPSLSAEKDGLLRARRIIAQDAISLVVIQADFFTRESVLYMLKNGYSLATPTQMVETGDCLPGSGPVGGNLLYLVSGPVSSSEQYLEHLPGVRDAFAGTSAASFFRAYTVPADRLTANLNMSAHWPSGVSRISFGGQVTVASVGSTDALGATRTFALASDLVSPIPAQSFNGYYSWRVALQDATGSTYAEASVACDMSPWMPGQRAYLLFSGLQGRLPAATDRIAIRVDRERYDVPAVGVGPVPLETAYALATIHYYLPGTVIPLPPSSCVQAPICANSGITLFAGLLS